MTAPSTAAPMLPADHECCADWKPQLEHVNGPILLQAARSGKPDFYKGIPFRFCPWCGADRRVPGAAVVGAAASVSGPAGEELLKETERLLNRFNDISSMEGNFPYDLANHIRALSAALRSIGVAASAARGEGFRVSVQESKESGDRITYWVCIDRPDRPLDAQPWHEGRITPFKSTIREHATSEAATWQAFLLPPSPGQVDTAGRDVQAAGEFAQICKPPDGLIEFIQSVEFALDDSEEVDAGNIIEPEHVKTICANLDLLNQLPDRPGYTCSAAAKVSYYFERSTLPAAATDERGLADGNGIVGMMAAKWKE